MSDSPWLPPSSGGPPPPPPPPSGAPVSDQVVGQPVVTQPVEVVPAPPERRRSKGAVVGAVVGAVAVVAAGVFAVRQLSGADDGGASNPEALGEELIAALESEDVLGLVDLLLPGERDVFREPMVDLVDDLSRLAVLSDDASLSGIAGLEVEITDSAVEVEPTNVDDIVNVRVAGDLIATVDGETLPLGDLVRERLDPDADLDATDGGEFSLPSAAVEDDGRWYLSLFFTAAESARQTSWEEPDIPATGVTPVGGDTPEDALDNLLDAVESLDAEAMIAALNPGEAAALQRYAPLFLDDAQAALDEAPLEWRIAEAEYGVEGGGDRRRATVELLVIEGVAEGDEFRFEFDGGCGVLEVPSQELVVDTCALADEQSDQLEEVVGEVPATQRLIDTFESAFADAEPTGVTLVRTDGEWYVSPIGTFLDAVLAVTGALDRDELDTIVESVPDAIDEWFGQFETDIAIEDTFEDSLEDSFEDTLDDPLDPTGDTVPGDDELADDTVDPASECYQQSTGTEAATCFADLLEAGTIEGWEVPVELRFAECGMADVYWTGYSALSDEDFFATVDPARDCFLTQAAAAQLEEWELPYWVTHPECFEDRNWYGTFDDPEYDDRFFACVSAE